MRSNILGPVSLIKHQCKNPVAKMNECSAAFWLQAQLEIFSEFVDLISLKFENKLFTGNSVCFTNCLDLVKLPSIFLNSRLLRLKFMVFTLAKLILFTTCIK